MHYYFINLVDTIKSIYMRDPNRIKPFLEEIEKLWFENPDWRFGQLVINVTNPGVINTKIFHMEEDEFLKKIEEEKKVKRE